MTALLGLSESIRPRWQPIADRIAAITGQQPDAFGLAAYDAAWLAALAFIETGGSGALTGLKAAVMRTADRTLGVTGPMTLNEAGDRATGDFDFWAIAESDGGYAWRRVAHYMSAPGAITRDVAGAQEAATPAG